MRFCKSHGTLVRFLRGHTVVHNFACTPSIDCVMGGLSRKRKGGAKAKSRTATPAEKRARLASTVAVTPEVEVVTALASQHDNQPIVVADEQVVEQTNVVADGEIGLEDFFQEEGKAPPLSNKSRRIAIAYIFEAVHGGQEDSPVKPWNGQGGVIPQIKKALAIPLTTNITYILDEFLNCKEFGITYDGSRLVATKLGRQPMLANDSLEAQIVADSQEEGASVRHSHYIVNTFRREQDLLSLTLGCVYALIVRLKPKAQRVKYIKQGSNDPTSPWARARLAWIMQLAIRFGLINFHGPFVANQKNYFDAKDLSPLSVEQVASWDETHRRCVVSDGKSVSKKSILRFRRDANGKLDDVNGTFSKNEITEMNCKYTDEVRLCLGCAVVTLANEKGEALFTEEGEPIREGRRANPFDYSGKTVVTIKDFGKKMKKQIEHVKSLKNAGGWVRKNGHHGDIYQSDQVTKLKGLGDQSTKKLAVLDIKTVAGISAMSEDDILFLSTNGKNPINRELLQQFRDQAQTCHKEDRPAATDYRKAANPYLAKFGEANWKKEIKKASFMTQYVCITEMVEHIVVESARMYKGTTHEADWMFYHDALSLMMAKDTIKWMKEEGHYERWILPQCGLLEDDKDLKRYYGRPVGDTPEIMAWDNSLNKDVHESVNDHVQATINLEKNDPRKFSLATPKEGARAYMRVVHPCTGVCPRSERIIQDTEKAFGEALLGIIACQGTVMDESCLRSGHRAGAARIGREKKPMGGYSPRLLGFDDYGTRLLHVDAQGCALVKVEASIKRCGHKSPGVNVK